MKRSPFMGLAVLIVVTALFVAACGKLELYQNLTEEDANAILVLLSENGIKAKKKKEVRQNEVIYAIEVKEADMVQARSLLVKHSLPRRRELGLTGVYKEKGLIPTPDEQKARYLLALKGEIINSLQSLPEVVAVDVVLNMPTRDEFASADIQHAQRPTASVVVRVKPEPSGIPSLTEAKIQQFVANAVESLNPRDVTVVISYLPTDEKVARPGDVRTLETKRPELFGGPAAIEPAVQHELIGLKLDADSKDRLKVYLLIFFMLLIILSVTLIVVIVQGSRTRRELEMLRGPAGHAPAIEGQVMEEAPPRLGEGPPSDEF